MPERFFATCPRGLEALLGDELAAAGARELAGVPGGVEFAGDWAVCYRANLTSRIATRILWRVAHGAYAREDDIYRLAYECPWPQCFDVTQTLRASVTAIKSPLRSLDFITLRVKDAVCDRFRAECGKRPSVDTRDPDVRIHAFLTAERATLYLDTSGAPLYKRGYKHARVEAPIKENLAAGIVRLSGWTPGEAFLDPMCGSGTLLIEAAFMALDVAPGLGRRFAFENLAGFDAAAWGRIVAEAEARCLGAAPGPLFGGDLYGDELKRARTNLAVAGLSDVVALTQANVLEMPAPAAAGVMVTNPPYGVRMGEEQELAAFYPRLGDALKRKFAGWRCYLFSADTALPRLIGLKPSRRTPLFNGALECRLYEFRMVAGGMRRVRPEAG